MKKFFPCFFVLLLCFTLFAPCVYADYDIRETADGEVRYVVVQLDEDATLSLSDSDLSEILEEIKESIDRLYTSEDEDGEGLPVPSDYELYLMTSIDSVNAELQHLCTAADSVSVLTPYQSELLTHVGYIEAFLLFFAVIVLCYFVYRFLRLFF